MSVTTASDTPVAASTTLTTAAARSVSLFAVSNGLAEALSNTTTNCPLARLDLFRSLYNIQKKDKMYWSSTDTIW
jgi:hypothetical protein